MTETKTPATPATASPAAAASPWGSSLVGRLGIALAPAAIALGIAFAGGLQVAPPPVAEPVAVQPVAAASPVTAASPITAANFSAAQRTELETIIRDYLVRNPEVLFEAKEAFDRKQEEQQMAAMKASIATNKDALFKNDKEPMVNPVGTDVTVVEFFDYNCGYCRHAVGDVAKLINADKKVRVIFKEFPIFGEDSEAAARVALAANKQGKYWEMHQALFERKGQDKVDGALALELAKGLGLDVAKLQADADSEEVRAELASTRKLAESMGIQGTPHFFIGDNVIPGAPRNLLEVMNGHIASVRKNGCSVC